MPAIGGAGVALLATKIFASVKVGSLAYSAIALGAEAGFAFLFNKLLKKDKKNKDRDPEQEQEDPSLTRETVRQPLVSQRLIFGSPKVPGVLIFAGVSSEGADAPDVPEEDNPGGKLDVGQYLVEQHAFAGHETNGLLDLSVGSIKDVQFGQSGFANTPPFFIGGKSYLAVRYRNGRAPISDIIKRNFPNLPDTHLQQGHTIIDAEFAFGEDQEANSRLWRDGRDLRAHIRGISVFDPRDTFQIAGDPSTYKYSNNPALILAFLLQYQKFMPSGLTYDDIDMDWLIWSANICDEGVPVMINDPNSPFYGQLHGVEKRYTADGAIDFNQRQIDIIENLTASMSGTLVHDGVKYVIKAGGPEEPVGSIGTHQVVIEGGFGYTRGVPGSEHLTRMSVRCIVPEIDYAEAALPVVIAEGSENEHPQNEGSLTLPYTQGASRGQRMGMIALDLQRRLESLVVNVTQDAWLPYIPSDVISFHHDKMPQFTGLWQITDIRPDEFFNTAELSMNRYLPEIYNTDPARLKVFDVRGLRD